MKTLKLNKIFAVLMLACLVMSSLDVFAQKKTLKTESDGYQWYKLEQNGKVGAQSVNGTTFIPLSRGYTSIYFYSGWFHIEKNKLEGICDIMGKEVVAPKYEYVFPHDHINGYIYFEVVFNGRRGVCSMNGQEIITPKYDEVVCVDQDGYSYYYVELNGKKGACDMNGREIISPRYESWYFSSSSGTFHYEDSSGKWVSTGVKLEKSSSTVTPTPQPQPKPTPTPTPQPQPQPRQPQPFQVWQPCAACGGSGQCHICLGTGHSLQNPNSTCFLCNGTGKCTHCAGHGGQNVIEYH